ncbi:hypothetical protein [Streptomyces xanthophaeus]
MQQSKHAHQRLVGVDVFFGRPASEQLTLLVKGEGLASEAVRLLRDQAAGRVDQHQLLGPREAEELPQHGQSPFAGSRQDGQEGLDVVHVDEGPVGLVSLVDQEDGQVPHRGQGSFQSVVAAGAGAGSAGPVLGSHPEDVECRNGWSLVSGTASTRR